MRTWQAERAQDSPAAVVQKASVTSAPASRTGTMERGSAPAAIATGFMDAVSVLVRRQPQQLHGKMVPSSAEKWQGPIQKAGVLVG
jgi:hypothetical protein